MIAVLTLGALTAPALASGDANLLIGEKSLRDQNAEEWGVDGQSQMGVALSLDFDWPVMLAIDLLQSSKDNTAFVEEEPSLEFLSDVQTTELDVGVRKFWGDKLKPYIGGGLAYVELDSIRIEHGDIGIPGSEYWATIVDDSDSGIGLWLNTGFLYRVGQYLNVGVDIRYSDAEADLVPFDAETLTLDSGGTHYGVLLGYHW